MSQHLVKNFKTNSFIDINHGLIAGNKNLVLIYLELHEFILFVSGSY